MLLREMAYFEHVREEEEVEEERSNLRGYRLERRERGSIHGNANASLV